MRNFLAYDDMESRKRVISLHNVPMSANLSSSNINAQFQSKNVKRQRGNDQSRFVDWSSTPLKRPYHNASKDASIFRTVASEGYADEPNSPDVQDLGKHVVTNEDDEILKNLTLNLLCIIFENFVKWSRWLINRMKCLTLNILLRMRGGNKTWSSG